MSILTCSTCVVFFFTSLVNFGKTDLCFDIKLKDKCRTSLPSDDVDNDCNSPSYLSQCLDQNKYEMLIDKYCNVKDNLTPTNPQYRTQRKECSNDLPVEVIIWSNTTCDESCKFTSNAFCMLLKQTVPTSSTLPSVSSNDNSKHFMIPLIVTSVVAFAVIIFFSIVVLRYRRRRRNIQSPQTKQAVKTYSQLQEHAGDITTKSHDQVESRGSHTAPQSGNDVYDRPDLNDIEIQPNWEPFHNDSAAIFRHSEFSDSVMSHNGNDGYDVPVGDIVASSVKSPAPVMKTDSIVDTGDNTTTGSYFVLDDQRMSQNYNTVQTYFVLEGERDNDAVTTSVSDTVDTADKAGQYSKLGEISRKKDNTYGMMADKTNPDVASRSSLIPHDEQNNNITMTTTVSDPGSIYSLPQTGRSLPNFPCTPRENVQHVNENLHQATGNAKTEETSVNYFELESS